jgi:hypothetical protein
MTARGQVNGAGGMVCAIVSPYMWRLASGLNVFHTVD